MTEYIKIETPFERDTEGSKKLIEGQYRNGLVEYLANNQWVCTEKVDGTNIGVVWDGHRVSFQGRTEKAQIPKPLESKLEELFGGEENEELFEQLFGDKQVIFFGEGYGPKIQKGHLYRDDASFIMFDILVNGIWLNRSDVEEIGKTFGIDVVPVIMMGTLAESIDFVKTKPVSRVGKNGAQMEGLVCKPFVEVLDKLGNRIVVKLKVKDFC